MKVLQEIGNLIALEHNGIPIVVERKNCFAGWDLFSAEQSWNQLQQQTQLHAEKLLELIEECLWWYDQTQGFAA